MFFFLLYLQFYAFYFNLFTKIFSKTSRKAVNISDKLLILDTCLCVKQGTEAFYVLYSFDGAVMKLEHLKRFVEVI